MKIKVAINGFGRIGRAIARLIFEKPEFSNFQLVAINASADAKTLKHLLSFDSIHGIFGCEVLANEQELIIKNQSIKLINQRDPAMLPWQDLGVDLVFECTGAFTSLEDASKHLLAGAKKVIISAPAKESKDAKNLVKTIVYGVNHNQLNADDKVISIGSCTTNCLAPIANILHQKLGIVKGLMTTIHAYTNDQNIVDNTHKDLRRARAAAMSMIPTSTGAAKALSLVVPELKGRLDGVAIRVPTPNVSMVDLNFVASRHTSIEEINKIISDEVKASAVLQRVVQVVVEPLVSIDFNHSEYSSCFDTTQTKVLQNDFVKVASWYDNEWAFSVRMLDVAKIFAIN